MKRIKQNLVELPYDCWPYHT